MFQTTKFISNQTSIFKIVQKDLYKDDFAVFLIKQVKHYNLSNVILDISLFEVISHRDIQLIEKIIHVFKLNNIRSIVCGINPYSAGLIPHFSDTISFQVTLGIKEALDAF
jgi:hypothetical protein